MTRSMTSSMNTQSNAVREAPLNGRGTAPATMPEARLMYWSVRRELWENRSLYLAPLAAAAVGMLAFASTVVRSETGKDFQNKMMRSRRSPCSDSRE